MTYTSGGLIQATDLNNFTANVNAVLTAYGQTTLPTANPESIVTATQWASLNSAVTALGAHQGTTITSRTSPVAGDIIAVLNNFGTDIATLNTNYANAATQGTQYTGWTGSSSKTTDTVGNPDPNSPWTITFTHTVSFANTTAATNFFNSGGTIRIQFSKTSTGTTEDAEWNSFVPKVGTIVLTGAGASKTITGQTYRGVTVLGNSIAPTTIATSTGVLQLTSTPVTLCQTFDEGAGVYSSNYIRVVGSVSGSVLTLTTTWFDDGTGSNPLVPSQITGGTATTGISFGTAPATVVTYVPPETTYLVNSWGTPTIAATVA